LGFVIIDQFPDERTEAVHPIKASNIRHEEELTEYEISGFEPGDLVLARVHESTTDSKSRIGDDSVTLTIFGQAVSKDHFDILLEKHPKYGVFAPIASRGSKGLQGLNEFERISRIGFRNKGEPFDGDRLTSDDPEFLSCHDPLELEQSVLDPWLFIDLSYKTSLYWSSNMRFKGYLKVSSTCRVFELCESNRRVNSELSNGAMLTTSATDNDVNSRTALPPDSESSEKIVGPPPVFQEMWE
jgi:hypothetical protein